MECEYAKLKNGSRTQCECTLRKDSCGYVYYCHPDQVVKNTTGYINCVRRRKAQEKKEESGQ